MTLELNELSQYFIDPEVKDEVLEMFSHYLSASIMVLDSDMKICFMTRDHYQVLDIGPNDLKVGDHYEKFLGINKSQNKITDDGYIKYGLDSASLRNLPNDGKTTEKTLVNPNVNNVWRTAVTKTPSGHLILSHKNVTKASENKELLEDALNIGEMGYWVYDIAAKTYEVSKTLEYVIGRDRLEYFQTAGVGSLFYPDDVSIFKDAVSKALKSDKPVEFEARFLTSATQQKSILAKGYSLDNIWSRTILTVKRDSEGRPLKLRGFQRNITRERMQEQALEKAKDEAIAASKAKSEFLANMSHEIRTPMNGILGMAELLANTNIDERQHEFIKVINSSATALLTIINDILDFSKIEAGAFELDPMPFDLKETVNDVAALLSSKAQEKNLELIVNYGTNLSRFFIGDVGRIRQILTNLLGNAIKFTDEGYVVADIDIVNLDQDNRAAITIKIKDTGIGIEKDKLDRIFQKFTQADGSTTRLYGGTGLGLSISKHIVEMMGGNMKADSEFGKGSTFTFTMPLEIDPHAKQTRYDTSAVIGRRALIVDDISVNRSLLTEHLEAWNMQATAVKDGVDALIELRNATERGEPYDIILLDYLMPGMNGQELASVIYNNKNIPRTPVIMLSSCDQPVSSSDMKKIDIATYLVKPVREQRLFDTLIRTLSDTEYNKPKDIATRESMKTSFNEVTRDVGVDGEIFAGDAPSTATQAGFEILVAEDFALNQDVVRLMLSDTVFNPVFANNGKEAVELFTSNPDRFKLILMDISMPVMDGYEACKQILAYEEHMGRGHTPIIALTGHALKHDRERCIAAGMDAFLTKPVKQVELIESLEHWTTQSGNAIASKSA